MNESHFKALTELARNGEISQRELARKIGLSVGRVNYIVNSLIKSGHIKAKRFQNSKRKLGYIYLLTPKGMKQKIEQTMRFLQKKTTEYERLLSEIEQLKSDAARFAANESRVSGEASCGAEET